MATAVLLVPWLFACSGGAGERTAPTLTLARALPSPTSAPAAGDPAAAVENAVLACREKDAERLRAFVAVRVSDQAIQALFARGTDVRLAGRTPAQTDGGRASVDVRLEIHRTGAVEHVERTWRLERGADGIWRFTELPDCY